MTLPRAMNSRNSPKIGTRREAASRGSGSLTAKALLVRRVEPLAQLLAALEDGHVLGAHRDRLAGPGIAAGAGVARADRQGAEAAQLHTAAVLQRLDHALQHHAHQALDVALGEV